MSGWSRHVAVVRGRGCRTHPPEEWTVGLLDLPFLTVVVQLGFALGAIVLAVIGAPDVIPRPRLFAAGAVVAAIANLGFGPIATDPTSAVPFRSATGAALAAVYPVAMKLGAGWFRRDRGLAIGVVNGALTVGVALPLLFRALGAYAGVDWRPVVVAASVAGIAGALLVGVAGRTGPLDVAAPRFSPAIAAAAFREPSVRLASVGYFGHMGALRDVDVDPDLPDRELRGRRRDRSCRSGIDGIRGGGGGGVGSAVAGASPTGSVARPRRSRRWRPRRHRPSSPVFCSARPSPHRPGGAHLGDLGRGRSAQFSSAVSELAPPGTAGRRCRSRPRSASR